LHGNAPIENSRAAFEAAIAAGHGIELDVRPSRDGDAFVFHDDVLERLTGDTGAFGDRGSSELRSVRLRDSDESIPALLEILALIDSRVPTLIELKARDRDTDRLCASVCRALDDYQGPVGVMSFNPQIGRWFAHRAPDILRGLVVTEAGRKNLLGRFERWFSLRRSRADFLAYDIRDLPSDFAAAARARGLKVATWTVRSPAERATAKAHADQVIYEQAGR
jgi:glycerophosphoryl diester phosphodiesterase